jgi:hypothetical protein
VGAKVIKKSLSKAVLDVSAARLPPFSAFSALHEYVNEYVKVASASIGLLVRNVGDPTGKDLLADLIKTSHPSWKYPPVRDLTLEVQRTLEESISSFAVLSAFSAFDDYLVGIEAEMSRVNEKKMARLRRMLSATDELEDQGFDRIMRLYGKAGWKIEKIQELSEVVRYFRLCRNCIAHRASRASRSLAEHSRSPALREGFLRLQKGVDRGIKEFEVDERVHLPHTFAITCSYVLWVAALDINQKVVGTFGVDGILKSATYHACRQQNGYVPRRRQNVVKVINRVLNAYRVKGVGRDNVIPEMKRIGIWDDYVSSVQNRKKGDGRTKKGTEAVKETVTG